MSRTMGRMAKASSVGGSAVAVAPATRSALADNQREQGINLFFIILLSRAKPATLKNKSAPFHKSEERRESVAERGENPAIKEAVAGAQGDIVADIR